MTYREFRETYRQGNPYSNSEGDWLLEKYTEWDEWNKGAWARGIMKLSAEERERGLESYLRLSHRMECEQNDTPDFETWKKKIVEENPWVVGNG